MKSLMKQILQRCGEEIISLGLCKKRRDLFLLPNKEDVYQGISLQHRAIADNVAEVHVFAIAIWDAVERKYAQGLSQKYILGNFFTNTEIMSVGDSFLFTEHENIDDKLIKFRSFINHDVLPQLKSVSNKSMIQSKLEREVSQGAGYPEKLLVIELEEKGFVAATVKFEELTSSLQDSFLVNRLANFWETLTRSNL